MSRVSATQATLKPRGLQGWAFLLPGVIWTGACFVVPLLVIALYSTFRRRGGVIVEEMSLRNYEKFFARESLTGSLASSLEVAATVVVLSILIAYPVAYILAYRVPPRWRRHALVLAIIPFWTSYVVRSYSWLLVLAENGIINQALLFLGLRDEPLSMLATRGAVVVGFVHFFAMLMTLTIFANLVQIKESYRKAAADLGASGLQTFVRVTLPLSVPGVVVGAFLTFVITIGDYVTPHILGGGRELLLPEAIVLRIVRFADFPMAAAMSLIMMVVITVVFLLAARHMRMDRV